MRYEAKMMPVSGKYGVYPTGNKQLWPILYFAYNNKGGNSSTKLKFALFNSISGYFPL